MVGNNLSCYSCCARSLVAFVAIILVLFQPTCTAKHHPLCPPSSCGKIHNITYPFRLKGDPRHCGLRRYELECVNNVTVLSLFSGKYHVQDINYTGYQIRLRDAGVVEDTPCSSIPRYFLYRDNFSFVDINPGDFFVRDPLTLGQYGSLSPLAVLFLNCSNPVTDDPRYVDVDTSHCNKGGHIYAVLTSSLGVGEFVAADIKVGCQTMVATFESEELSGIDPRNVSYADIQKGLVHGFWLSWFLPVVCKDKCGKGVTCSINETTAEVQCHKRYCRYVYHTTDKCGISDQVIGYTRGYLKGIAIGILSRITFSTKQLGDPAGFQYFDEAVFIGRNVISFVVAARYILGVAIFIVLLIYKWRRRHLSLYESIEHFLLDSNLNPIRYEYKEINKMTRGFKEKLGQGGFGSVYKGKLRSGPSVAIKMLSKSNGNGQEFINEVATIGRIHHVNVVRLVGFCVEGKKRALVYEFMPNGSLDKYIFSKEGSVSLSYEKIYEISLGVARGIGYLHQGCDMQILHFDIKPHNILLDNNFIPKVSDFGLAKLYPVDDSIVTLTAARGTIGYMAPELFYKNIGGVSYKADVYSFGMLLMEMAGKRKNLNPHAEHSSQLYFPFWIYDQFNEEKDIEMEDATEEEKNIAKKMFITALWCIQLKPNDRPSMKKVVEMLEGEIESLEMPPKPALYPHETFGQDDEVNFGETSLSDSSSTNSFLA